MKSPSVIPHRGNLNNKDIAKTKLTPTRINEKEDGANREGDNCRSRRVVVHRVRGHLGI